MSIRAIFSGLSYFKLNTTPITSSNYTDDNLNNGSTYYYVVTSQDSAGHESAKSVEVSASPSDNTSVSTVQDVGARVYPNPVDDLLYIHVEQGVSARIFDLRGRLLKSVSITSEKTIIPVSDLNAGQYIVQIITSDGSGVYKLIKR